MVQNSMEQGASTSRGAPVADEEQLARPTRRWRLPSNLGCVAICFWATALGMALVLLAVGFASRSPARSPARAEAPQPATTTSSGTPPSQLSAPEPGHDEVARATLDLSSIPTARVFLDGQDTGRETPVQGLAIEPGRHLVELRVGHVWHRYAVLAEPGKSVRLFRMLPNH